MKSEFCSLPIMLIHDESTVLESVPYLRDNVGCLVQAQDESCIMINVDNVLKTIKEVDEFKSKNIDSFINYIDAHESVHYLEGHSESNDELELMTDVYATCLCELKHLDEAAEIGLYKLMSKHQDEYDIPTLLQECKSNLTK